MSALDSVSDEGRSTVPITGEATALPKAVRYVKNGRGGMWWAAAKENSQIHVGWADIPHDLILAGDIPAMRELFKQSFGKKPGATQDFNALATLIHRPSQYLWVTFQSGYLWWCTVRDGVADINTAEDASRGHFWLSCDRPWSNRSVGGKLLSITDLPGSVTTVSGFKGTVCEPAAWDAILRIIRDEADPDVVIMEAARDTYERAVHKMIQRLGWRDFEQLTDVILLKSGWSRTSSLGKTQEGIDLEVENIATGEMAFVQVKSEAGQAVLDDYVARFLERRDTYARMIFAVHSPVGVLTAPSGLPLQIWTGPDIAHLVVRLGLGDWVARMLA